MASSLVSLLAIALRELLDGFLALLHEGLQDLNGFGFVERANFFDFLELDGGFDAAENAEAELVLGAHGVNDVFLDFFSETHGDSSMLNITEEFAREEKGKS